MLVFVSAYWTKSAYWKLIGIKAVVVNRRFTLTVDREIVSDAKDYKQIRSAVKATSDNNRDREIDYSVPLF